MTAYHRGEAGKIRNSLANNLGGPFNYRKHSNSPALLIKIDKPFTLSFTAF